MTRASGVARFIIGSVGGVGAGRIEKNCWNRGVSSAFHAVTFLATDIILRHFGFSSATISCRDFQDNHEEFKVSMNLATQPKYGHAPPVIRPSVMEINTPITTRQADGFSDKLGEEQRSARPEFAPKSTRNSVADLPQRAPVTPLKASDMLERVEGVARWGLNE